LSWRDSASRDAELIAEWHVANGAPDWGPRREHALRLLAESDHLESIAQLVGATSLPDRERVLLLTGHLLREAVLQQSSLSANDAYCPPAKQRALLALALAVEEQCLELVGRGIPARRIEEIDLSPAVRARDTTPPDGAAEVEAIAKQLVGRLGDLT
jgi:V/A-type H+-transporting ATPase subunit A